MARIDITTIIKKLAEVGIQGKTALLHFFPVMKTGQKVIATRPCACGYKHGLVMRAKEQPAAHIILCPKCGKFNYRMKGTNPPATQTDDDKCKGKTKANKRCKKTAMANGYCGTHQDQVPTQETRI